MTFITGNTILGTISSNRRRYGTRSGVESRFSNTDTAAKCHASRDTEKIIVAVGQVPFYDLCMQTISLMHSGLLYPPQAPVTSAFIVGEGNLLWSELKTAWRHDDAKNCSPRIGCTGSVNWIRTHQHVEEVSKSIRL